MPLWGPALDAEVEYRIERARQGARRTKEDRRVESRAERIRRGLRGMRPGHRQRS